jgi:adenylate cyclase
MQEAMVMHSGDAEAPLAPMTKRRRAIQRRLAAILAVDISGFSILMAGDEEDTHRRVRGAMDRLSREVQKFHGSVISDAGDGLMAEFPSAVQAVKCALRIQADLGRRNARLPQEHRIEYRMGIHSGEIVLQQGRAGGNVVNVAARLEQSAEPGGIFLSGTVFDQVSAVIATRYDKVGEHRLRNIAHPVMVYSIAPEACLSWSGTPAPRHQAASLASPSDHDPRPSLAVLPFRALREDMADAYFAQGMVDDIIRLLGGLKELVVIERTATFAFAGSPLDLRHIGRELSVRYVLHGSLQRSADKLRIAVELCEATSGQVIWADRLDGDLSELFDLQDRIAMRVVGAVAPHVRERELSRGLRKHPSSMTAYDLTLQALDQIYRMERDSFFRARALLRQAVMQDPRYAPVYSYIAYWHLFRVGQGWSDDFAADTTAAAQAAQAAVERDQSNALGLAFYGLTQAYLMKNFATAIDMLDRALVASPSCAWAQAISSLTCSYVGDRDNAMKRAQQAVRLSPLGPDAYFYEHVLSMAHYFSGQYEEAIAWGQLSDAHCGAQASNLKGLTSNLKCLIASLVAVGRVDEARLVGQRLLRLDPKFGVSLFRSRTPFFGEEQEGLVRRLLMAGLPD